VLDAIGNNCISPYDQTIRNDFEASKGVASIDSSEDNARALKIELVSRARKNDSNI
jgi:hypothetical protein